MSDHERGAYTPPTDAPLSFDARQPVRGSRPMPVMLILSILVLAGLAVAIVVFYRNGVRQAGQPPRDVGAPVVGMKAPPPPGSQPQDPAAGLQIYKTEGGKPAGAITPQFTAPPEQPQPRPEAAPTPKVVVTPMAAAQPAQPSTPAPALRPAIPAQPPTPAAPPKAETPAPKPPPPAPKMEKAQPAPLAAAKAVPAKPEAKPVAKAAAPAPAAKASGVAAVQIGAFSSQALADKGWSDAAGISPGAAAGKGKSVEKVEVNGKTLFRTQVTGFASRDAAKAFCDKLKAAGKACFVK
jgi:hypothetical protein